MARAPLGDEDWWGPACHAVCPRQGLRHGQPECEPVHGERALAVLHPVVRRRPLGHLRQLPRPPQGAFPHLAHGKHHPGRGWQVWEEEMQWVCVEVLATAALFPVGFSREVWLGLRVFP